MSLLWYHVFVYVFQPHAIPRARSRTSSIESSPSPPTTFPPIILVINANPECLLFGLLTLSKLSPLPLMMRIAKSACLILSNFHPPPPFPNKYLYRPCM